MGCGVWKNINKEREDFFKWIKFKVNDGGMVSFWHDPWCFCKPLANLFPNCYNLALNKRGTVKDFMVRSMIFSSWNIQPRRNLNDWEIEEMGRLLTSLEGYSLGKGGQPDEMIWLLDVDNGFSVKSMFDGLCPSNQRLFPGTCVWNPEIQSKVSFLLCELWWNRAPTIDNLIKTGMLIPNWCCLCIDGAESVNHLFIHSTWASYYWHFFMSRFGVSWASPNSFRCFLGCRPGQDLGVRSQLWRKMWVMLSAAVCWAIWEERNSRIFEGKA